MDPNNQKDPDCEGKKNLGRLQKLIELLIRLLQAIARLLRVASKTSWFF
jgi:hypothetical protein